MLPGRSSCLIPCFSCIQRSMAIPTASGTESILFGPRPMTLSELSAPEGVTFLDDPEETVIATVVVPTEVEEPEIEEETELVGEGVEGEELPEGEEGAEEAEGGEAPASEEGEES